MLPGVGRWSLADLPRALRPTDHAPLPELGPFTPAPMVRLISSASELGVGLLDLRGLSRLTHRNPRRWGWFRDDDPARNIPKRGRARGTLPWRKRTAIMLHRTGVAMSPRRFIGCPCHCAVASDATIVLCHPNDAYVWHGHAENRFAVGVEISSSKGGMTSLQAKAARLLIEYVVEDLRQHGTEPAIMAHRQSHSSRTHDPGAWIWRVVAGYAVANFGLREGPVVGSGREIPKEWW